jgi:hypothetical protein
VFRFLGEILVPRRDFHHDVARSIGNALASQPRLYLQPGRITTHYSAVELSRLIEAAEKVCDQDGRMPELVVLRGAFTTPSRKTPAKRVGP